MMTKIACWDMDGLLGNFENIAHVMNGNARVMNRNKGDMIEVYLRADIKRVLGDMESDGFENILTSSAKPDYISGVLELVDLGRYFDVMLYKKHMMGNHLHGKHYKLVAEMYGLNEREAKSNMIVIGNQESDEPFDMSLVFIEDKKALETSAQVCKFIITTLYSAGEEDFGRGFDNLYTIGNEGLGDSKRLNYPFISFSMGRRQRSSEIPEIPVIFEIEVEPPYRANAERLTYSSEILHGRESVTDDASPE